LGKCWKSQDEPSKLRLGLGILKKGAVTSFGEVVKDEQSMGKNHRCSKAAARLRADVTAQFVVNNP
jgi:hypothetical protein